MAKRIIHELIDDIDGTEAHETVTFSIDGASYEIDLSGNNAAKLRGLLHAYINSGRRVTRQASSGPWARATRGTATRQTKDENKAAREWLLSHGYSVGVKGRIPNDLWDAYGTRKAAPGWKVGDEAAKVIGAALTTGSRPGASKVFPTASPAEIQAAVATIAEADAVLAEKTPEKAAEAPMALGAMTRAELVDVARKAGLEPDSRMTKPKLIQAITAKRRSDKWASNPEPSNVVDMTTKKTTRTKATTQKAATG